MPILMYIPVDTQIRIGSKMGIRSVSVNTSLGMVLYYTITPSYFNMVVIDVMLYR